jgi:hypothetical protein
MGRQKLKLRKIDIKDFSKGYFPNKDFDDVPEGGSNNCRHVICNQSELRKMFGMDLITATAASETAGKGLFYFNTNGVQKRVAVFGTKLFWDNGGTWTDVTGAVTISGNNLCQFIDHQQGANEYIIVCNGTDPVFKWTGTGNAAVLGGSPPVFTSIEKFGSTLFGSSGQFAYFSDIGDPETWDTAIWLVTFGKDIVNMLKIGNSLAVMMGDHIGSITGNTELDFAREEERIGTFGCVGRQAACKAKFGTSQSDVLAVLATDGLHFIDVSFGHSHVFGKDWIQDFSVSDLSKATLAYDNTEKLLYCALPYAGATQNDYLIVVDMISGAVWPCPDIHAQYIKSMASCLDSSLNEYVYFIDNAGYGYKFNRLTTDYHSGTAAQAIDAYWRSKKYDLEEIHDIRWISALANIEGDWSFTLGLMGGMNQDSAVSGAQSLLGTADVLDSTFILDTSTLGGSLYVFNYADGLGLFCRYLSFYVENNQLSQPFNLKQIEIQLKRRRMGFGDS